MHIFITRTIVKHKGLNPESEAGRSLGGNEKNRQVLEIESFEKSDG